jgi:hypothetical protein
MTVGVAASGGYRTSMSNVPDEHHVTSRADLLPEEVAAGSDDPDAQAAAILEESRERTDDPAGTGAESEQTSTPDQRPS